MLRCIAGRRYYCWCFAVHVVIKAAVLSRLLEVFLHSLA